MNSPTTIDEYIQMMAQGFRPQKAACLSLTYHLQVTGAEGGSWTVTIADRECIIRQGAPAQADTHIMLDCDSFRQFVAGKLNVESAYMQGRLKVDGNMSCALKLAELFSPWIPPASDVPPDAPHLTNDEVNNNAYKKGDRVMNKRVEANDIARKHVIWAMGAGLIPIPVLDFTAVTAVQIDMLSQLAKLYGVDYSTSTGKTFVAALTGTTAASIGASIVKAIPGIGTVIGGVSMSVMSGASTYAVAQVAIQHFESGGTLLNIDLSAAKGAYQGAFEEGKEFVSTLEKEKAASQDIFEKLEKLGKLKEQGIITEEEFQEQKQKLLDRL